MGRGLVATLARKSDTSNPPPLEREPEALKPISASELSSYKRVSPLQDVQAASQREQFQSVEPSQTRAPLPPAAAAAAASTQQRPEPPVPESGKPQPRGRGLLIRNVRKSVSEDVESPTQPSPPPITSSQVTAAPVPAPAAQAAKPPSAFSAPVEQITSKIAYAAFSAHLSI